MGRSCRGVCVKRRLSIWPPRRAPLDLKFVAARRRDQLATGRVRPAGGHVRRVRSPDLDRQSGRDFAMKRAGLLGTAKKWKTYELEKTLLRIHRSLGPRIRQLMG